MSNTDTAPKNRAMKDRSKSYEYRGVTIRVFPYSDSEGWNATTDYGNGTPDDCYLTSASTADEALAHAKDIVDREMDQ